MEALPDLNGQMVEDWFRQVLEACLYGMRQSGETEAPLEEEMDKRFWHCTDMAAVYRLLRQGIQAEIQRLKEAKALREMRPITEAKHYIQQHYQEALRLEDEMCIRDSHLCHRGASGRSERLFNDLPCYHCPAHSG